MLANILDRLPSMGGSHFVEARRNDPELVEKFLDELGDDQDELPKWRPGGAEWRQETELLGLISDQLGALLAVTAAHPIPQGGRRPDIPNAYPRPPRTLDRLQLERRERYREELDDEVEQAKARWRALQQQGEVPTDN